MPLDLPPGWLTLQERARRAKDARELAAIIDEMNALLAEYEKAAGDGDEPQRRARPQRPAKPVNQQDPK